MKKLMTILFFVMVAMLFVGCPQPNASKHDDPDPVPIVPDPVPDPDPVPIVPVAPSNLIATPVSYTQIDVAWTDNSDNETGFDFEWSKTDDFSTKSTEEFSENIQTFQVTELDIGTLYYFRVRSVNGVGNSEWVLANTTTLSIPVGTFVINADNVYTTSLSVTLNSNMTSIEKMRFQNNGGSWSDWENYSTTKTWNIYTPDGTKTINAEFKDQFDMVYNLSDSIILDTTAPTTPPPPIPGFTINGSALYATSASVTLNNLIGGATKMRFANDGGVWSAWENYAITKSWTVSSSQGVKTVYSQFKDDAGNQIQIIDTITLDTISPSVTYFRINNGDARTTTLSVTLNNSVIGASEVRYSNSGNPASWSGWILYESSRSWNLVGMEDEYSTAYAQFRDIAGNITQVSDTIIFDAYTTLMVLVDRIWIGLPGDPTGQGEWRWTASYHTSNAPLNEISISSGSKNVDPGDTIHINKSKTFLLPNVSGKSWTFRWHAWEDDHPLDDDIVGTITRTYTYPYETGHFEVDLGSNPYGVFYWSIGRVD